MNTRSMLVLALAAGSLTLSGCLKKAPASLPPDPGAAVSTDTTTSANQGPVAGSQADFAAQMMGQDSIYFDTDRYNIDGQDQQALAAQAVWLAKYPAKRITIEGHCDERGTQEYNLALGERRANAAKNYLVSLGIDAARITTVSYGKEKPVALGSDEESWAKNRRAVTVTID